MGWLWNQPIALPRFKLLCRCCLLLFCPAPLDGLGNALPSFRSKISRLLDGFLGGGGCRSGRTGPRGMAIDGGIVNGASVVPLTGGECLPIVVAIMFPCS